MCVIDLYQCKVRLRYHIRWTRPGVETRHIEGKSRSCRQHGDNSHLRTVLFYTSYGYVLYSVTFCKIWINEGATGPDNDDDDDDDDDANDDN